MTPCDTNSRQHTGSSTYQYETEVGDGNVILLSNRTVFNKNRIDPTRLLCWEGDETIEHFLLNCTALSSARQPIIDIITNTCTSLLS